MWEEIYYHTIIVQDNGVIAKLMINKEEKYRWRMGTIASQKS